MTLRHSYDGNKKPNYEHIAHALTLHFEVPYDILP